MINIVIPMAGAGSRFLKAGYTLPKPLISVHGVPMIEVVVNNVRPRQPHRFIFLVLKDHLERFNLRKKLECIANGCIVIPVTKVTEGAACTVLLASDAINNDAPLMLVNSDQWVDTDINDYLSRMDSQDIAGLIMTMYANDPKWSYVGMDESEKVTRIAEKEVISNEATVGIYNFKRGNDYVRAAEQMIAKNLRINNEFYVAPVYNEMIGWGARVAYCNVGKVGAGMYGMGTPNDLSSFLNLPLSRKAVGK